MNRFIAYIRTFYAYIQTPKGRYDFLDFLRAFLIIILVSVFIGAFLQELMKL
ncbi:hypothetical protein [Anaerosinus sp.]